MEKIARRFVHRFLLGISVSALVLCPHSKVEESFQLQATHDLYYHGLNLEHYDHLQFPGVVPRTFLGPLILATICRIITTIASPLYTLDPLQVQLLARGVLLLLTLQAWFRLASTVPSQWKGTYLLLVTAIQFHMPFYASRMLPNTFALILVLHAYAEWFRGNIPRAAVLLVVCTAVFRCDVLLLLFTVGLTWLMQGKLKLVQAIRLGILAGVAALCVTVPLDTYLWQQQYPLWAEGAVFYYNTVLGKSSNWGTSPWYWYMASALPKAMLLTILFVPLAVLRIPEHIVSLLEKRPRPPSWVDTSLLSYLLPILGFIGLYSCLGHKEMRFIFPAMPMLNLAAASGLERLHVLAFVENKDKRPSILAKLMYTGALLCCFVTLLASLAFVGVSRHNYPGGTAMQLLVDHVQPQNESVIIKVHVDVAAAMTGVSLFGQRAAGFEFSKAGYEDENSAAADYSSFTHLLSETKDIPGFSVVATAPGHPRLDWRNFRIATEDGIYVLERYDEASKDTSEDKDAT